MQENGKAEVNLGVFVESMQVCEKNIKALENLHSMLGYFIRSFPSTL